MFSYIKGELTEKNYNYIVVETGGVGFEIQISGMDYSELPVFGSEVKIYTHFSVTQDNMSLFGFLSKDSKDLFELLTTVNGIGPKAAMSILSALTPDDIRFAVLSQDSKAISKAPGVGKKTAERIILELKDKISLDDAFEKKLANQNADLQPSESAKLDSSVQEDAVAALVALGYTAAESLKAVSKVAVAEDMTIDDILRESLKSMALF